MRTRDAYSLIEMSVVLALLAALLGIALPPAARWRDDLAVRAARDELASAAAWTRMAAVGHGGATLIVDPAAARFRTRTADGGGTPPVDLGSRYGVRLESSGGGSFELRYDGLGIGRIASRTVLIRRGGARAGLTISAYGRARRW